MKTRAKADATGPAAKLAGFAPGEQPTVYPTGTAKLPKAGAKLLFQLHYTPKGGPDFHPA